MEKLHKLADWDGFDGIGYPPKISEFDQHDILVQLLDDGSNLSFGKVRYRKFVQCRNDIK